MKSWFDPPYQPFQHLSAICWISLSELQSYGWQQQLIDGTTSVFTHSWGEKRSVTEIQFEIQFEIRSETGSETRSEIRSHTWLRHPIWHPIRHLIRHPIPYPIWDPIQDQTRSDTWSEKQSETQFLVVVPSMSESRTDSWVLLYKASCLSIWAVIWTLPANNSEKRDGNAI